MAVSFEKSAIETIQAAGLCEGCPFGTRALTSARGLDEKLKSRQTTDKADSVTGSWIGTINHDLSLIGGIFTKLHNEDPCTGGVKYDKSDASNETIQMYEFANIPIKGVRCGLEERNIERMRREFGEMILGGPESDV